MALETEAQVRARLAEVAPGAQVTSSRRSVEHNRRVGGVPGSLHTREGEDGGARALDVVPGTSGLTMAQLNQRIGNSGLRLQERLNEGDHVHIGFDGVDRTRQGGGGGQGSVMVDGREHAITSVASEFINATPEELVRAGFRQADNGQWVREQATGGAAAVGSGPDPLDTAYARRQEDRESLALDQEEARIVQAALVPDEVVGAVAGDVGRGVFLEGGQAALSGVKRGVNEILDLGDAAADWIEQYVPGTVMWEGFDGDDSTPARIFLTTQNEAERRMTEARDGAKPSWLQRLGMAQTRTPTSEGERPETVTGRLIEGVTQFGAGFAGGGQVLRGWQTASRAGRLGKAMVQGAIGDFSAFDGNEARLSNLLAEHAPEALGPVLSLLAANEDDPELLGRAKNAVEGTILGGAADLIMGGIRALRGARAVKTEARAAAAAEGLQEDPTIALAEAAQRGEALEASVREALGNPEGPRFRVRKFGAVAEDADAPVRDMASKVDDAYVATAGSTPRDIAASADNVFDINLARIQSPEDVQAVIVGMADRFAKDADLARRGVQSWEATTAAANGIDWVRAMGERRVGDAVNAETALSYRQALNASANQLLDLARRVETEPTLANQYAFRRATATHAAIQNELLGARAEAGRALNAFKIPAGAPATYLRQVDSLVADAGGANSAQELAKRLLDAAQKGDAVLNNTIHGGALARTREIIKLVYTNSLLSGPGTSIINVAGNGMMMGLNYMSRAISPRLARAFGGQASTQVGEAGALLHGYQQALRDMFALNPMEAAARIGDNAGEALRRDGLFRGMAPGIDDAAPQGVPLRAQREEAGSMTGRPLSAAAWRVNEDSPLGRTLDIIQMLVDAPSNINALTDDFFKVVSARGELHSQAFRQVTSEGLEGEAARARYADLIQNPTDDMLAAAEREMHDLTFTRETPGMANDIASLRRHMDDNPTAIPFGSIVFPFVRTPANLISTGLRYSPLAPFASRRFRDAIRAGGAEAENAKAKVALGAAFWSVWMGMAMDGDISGRGPMNRGQREALQRADEFGGVVFQPYSVRVGDRWVSYERADPLGQGLSLVADMAELMRNVDWDAPANTEWDEIMAHGIMAIGQAFFDKTVLRSATEFTTALTGSTAEGERLMMQRISGAIPGSSALRTIRRGEDPYLRETHSVLTAMMNTVPGLSDDLPAQRDLWGRERRYYTEAPAEAMGGILGLQNRAIGGTAIDLEILNNGVSVTMPTRNISVGGETVSLRNRPDIYSEFVRLSGEPAFEHLNAVAEGRHADSEFYFTLSDGPDGGKADYISDVIRAYRSDARAQILDMYASDLQSMAADRMRRREDVRGGEVY